MISPIIKGSSYIYDRFHSEGNIHLSVRHPEVWDYEKSF